MVDRGSITPVTARDVFAAAARFVHGLDPADHRRALHHSHRSRRSTSRPTTVRSKRRWDRSTGRATFNAVRWASGIAEALAFEKNNTIMMDQTIERRVRHSAREAAGRVGLDNLMVCHQDGEGRIVDHRFLCARARAEHHQRPARDSRAPGVERNAEDDDARVGRDRRRQRAPDPRGLRARRRGRARHALRAEAGTVGDRRLTGAHAGAAIAGSRRRAKRGCSS